MGYVNKILTNMGYPKTSTLGGLSKGMPDSKFDNKELALGTAMEMKEHGVSVAVSKSIAKDHLVENPKYYSEMKKSEGKY